MRCSFGNATEYLGGVAAALGLALLGCDRPPMFGPRHAQVARVHAQIVGSYAGTAVATVATSINTSSVACPGVLAIATQSGTDFSGSFAVQSAQGCDAEQGTIAGTVRDDGTLSFTADTPGGGANVWEDGAGRKHRRLVSGSTFDGAASGGSLAATGRGVYDCPVVGTVRVSVSFQVSTVPA
jgi:hypothetical protein